jgi:hypothetical protein
MSEIPSDPFSPWYGDSRLYQIAEAKSPWTSATPDDKDISVLSTNVVVTALKTLFSQIGGVPSLAEKVQKGSLDRDTILTVNGIFNSIGFNPSTDTVGFQATEEQKDLALRAANLLRSDFYKTQAVVLVGYLVRTRKMTPQTASQCIKESLSKAIAVVGHNIILRLKDQADKEAAESHARLEKARAGAQRSQLLLSTVKSLTPEQRQLVGEELVRRLSARLQSQS